MNILLPCREDQVLLDLPEPQCSRLGLPSEKAGGCGCRKNQFREAC